MDEIKGHCYCFPLANYLDDIVFIRRRIKAGPLPDEWTEVAAPYITVEGRLRIFVDLHDLSNPQVRQYWERFYGPRFDELDLTPPLCSIETEIVPSPVPDRFLVIKATISSKLLPLSPSVGYATAEMLHPRGVDESFPLENAETSAIGRALSNMGIGNIPGMGRASFQEMQEAAKREKPSSSLTKPTPSRGTAPKYSEPMRKCLSHLKKLQNQPQEAFGLVESLCDEMMLPKPQPTTSGFPDLRKYDDEQLALLAEALEMHFRQVEG